MNAWYMILGMVAWKWIMNVVNSIWDMSDEAFYRIVQSMNENEKNLAVWIRNIGKRG